MKITLVLHNIRSTYNVGAILRTAEGFGISEVILSGYTPWYEKPGLLPHLALKLERQITKTAVGADKMVTARWSEDILATLAEKKASGAILAGLENNISDKRLVRLSEAREALKRLSGGRFKAKSDVLRRKTEVSSTSPEGDFPEVVLILGEEVEGIPAEVLSLLDLLFEIPMRGQKESFNVSVAAGIALYELNR